MALRYMPFPEFMEGAFSIILQIEKIIESYKEILKGRMNDKIDINEYDESIFTVEKWRTIILL